MSSTSSAPGSRNRAQVQADAVPLRLAVLGVGRMGSFHLEALGSEESLDIVAVFDVRAEAAEKAAARAGAEPFFTLDELADRSEVDGWLVATPTPTHPDLVRTALAAGIHVLCEKPLSLDLDCHDRLEGAAEAAGLVLQVGFWRRFSPPWQTARRLILEGAIGQPLYLRLSQWDANPPPAEFCDPNVSGGLAIDCGVHEYDLAEWLTGLSIEQVVAKNLPTVEPGVAAAGDVDNLVAILQLEGGISASVDLSRNSRYGDDVRTEVLGSDGAIFVESLPSGATRLASDSGVTLVSGSRADDPQRAGVVGQAQSFARAVSGEVADFPGATASRRAVAVGLAIQEAAKIGEPISMR